MLRWLKCVGTGSNSVLRQTGALMEGEGGATAAVKLPFYAPLNNNTSLHYVNHTLQVK